MHISLGALAQDFLLALTDGYIFWKSFTHMGSKILACPTWEPCQLCAVEVHDRGFAMGGQSQNINGGTGWGG